MKALILAAGLGSRLNHETHHLPKALVNVNGKPILSYQIEALIANRINELIVVLGKESEKIVEFFNTYYSDLKVQFIKNPDFDKTNSSYSFWLAKDYLIGGNYIHINCDIIFSQRLLKRLLTNKNPNLIAVRTDLELTDEMENVVIVPHLGSATIEGRIAMGECVVVNVKSFVDGHKAPNRVLEKLL